MEIADLVVINKADIDPDAATRARAQIQSAMRLLGMQGNPEHMALDSLWQPKVIQISGLLGQGLDSFWGAVKEFERLNQANGRFAARRQQQAIRWMWERIESGLKAAFRNHPAVRDALPGTAEAVLQGQLAPSSAARRLLALAQAGAPASAECDA